MAISASLRPGNIALVEETPQWWPSVGNSLSDYTGSRFKSQTSRFRSNALQLDQLSESNAKFNCTPSNKVKLSLG